MLAISSGEKSVRILASIVPSSVYTVKGLRKVSRVKALFLIAWITCCWRADLPKSPMGSLCRSRTYFRAVAPSRV